MRKILAFLLILSTIAVAQTVVEESDAFCKSGNVYKTITHYTCNTAGCTSVLEFDQLITDCPVGCENGQCTFCAIESCNEKDTYSGSRFCKDGDVYREYRDYSCFGTCEYEASDVKIEECSFSVCKSGKCETCDVEECEAKDGFYGSNFCRSDDVYGEYRDYSCSSNDTG